MCCQRVKLENNTKDVTLFINDFLSKNKNYSASAVAKLTEIPLSKLENGEKLTQKELENIKMLKRFWP